MALKEHVHTLRCDRRERVCTAVGAIREFEWLYLEGLEVSNPPHGKPCGPAYTFCDLCCRKLAVP